jgi:hypothetical protein
LYYNLTLEFNFLYLEFNRGWSNCNRKLTTRKQGLWKSSRIYGWERPHSSSVEEAAKFEEEEDKIGLTANRCNSAYVVDIGVDISIWANYCYYQNHKSTFITSVFFLILSYYENYVLLFFSICFLWTHLDLMTSIVSLMD